ncbi:MAG TPA: inorganic phosphate transporter [Thermoleophilaceae bacterium]|jgi:PiT family inorganic phosphate transporter
MGSELLLIIVIAVALGFDFTNGFHDTANAMATSIATRALRPKLAVLLSAALNFAGAFISLKVATTISKGIVDSSHISLNVLLAGLIGAIVWNLTTWFLGLPSSSTHALIGGLIGAAWVADGPSAIQGSGVLGKVILPGVVSPILAGVVAIVATFVAYRCLRRVPDEHGKRGFRYGQIASASLVSLAHGTNDAQKTMGVITLALVVHGSIGQNAAVPTWVVLAAASAIGLGTYIGGWRIIRTMGQRLTRVEPPQGFAAETSGATVLLASSYFGYPLSTTHIVSGAIVGSGLGKRLADVRWGLAGRIALAWLVTLPAAGLVAALVSRGISGLGSGTGAVVVGLLALLLAAALFAMGQRRPVTAQDV